MKRLGVWAAVVAASVCVAAEKKGAGGAASKPSWDRYRILTERNIFSRDRRRHVVLRGPTSQPTTRSAGAAIVLRGIVRQGDDYIAFFEDTGTGQTTKARAGESVGKGRVKRITLDYVAYETGGREAQVRVGTSLAGTPAPRVTAASSQPVVSGTPTSRAGAPKTPLGGAEALSIIERLRQRRRKELQGK